MITLTEENLSYFILIVDQGYPFSSYMKFGKVTQMTSWFLCMYLRNFYFFCFLHSVIEEENATKYNQVNWLDS